MKKIFIILLATMTFVNFASAKKEVIKFYLKFGIIKGGEAEFIISDTLYNGNPAIYYSMSGRTTGLTDKLFGVHDIYETIVNSETRLPLKVTRDIQEGKYERYNETLFYHDIDSIFSQKSGWSKVPDNTVDLLTVFFYFINRYPPENAEPGFAVSFPSYHADEISNVALRYNGEKRMRTDIGQIQCYVLAPVVDKGKLLNRSDGMTFYISKKYKIPVQMEFDMAVGALRAVLKSYKIDGVEQKNL